MCIYKITRFKNKDSYLKLYYSKDIEKYKNLNNNIYYINSLKEILSLIQVVNSGCEFRCYFKLYILKVNMILLQLLCL